MVNRSEKGSTPLFGLYEKCLKHNLREAPLTRYLVTRSLGKDGVFPFKYPVTGPGRYVEGKDGESLLAVPYYGTVEWNLRRTDVAGNYIYDAKSFPQVTEENVIYYRPSGITYDSTSRELSFIIGGMDKELLEYLPESFPHDMSVFKYQTAGKNYPSWHAVEIDLFDNEINKKQILQSERLNKIFVEAAIQGQLPGFRNQQDPLVPTFSEFDFNKGTLAYPFIIAATT